MTLCPKCGVMMLTTTNRKTCLNCGWGSFITTGRTSEDTVDPSLTIPEESLENRSLETDINDLTIRVSALEADIERLKRSTRAKFENVVDQVGEIRVKMMMEHSRLGVKKILSDAEDDSEPEPKSCPFCTGSPKLESDSHRKEFGRDRFRIVCASCYAGTRWCDSPDEAWLMWNGRVKE